jgi:hypothetical protein
MDEFVKKVCMLDDAGLYKRFTKLAKVGVNTTDYAGVERDVVSFMFNVVLDGGVKLESSTSAAFCSIADQVFRKLVTLAL